MEIRADFVLTTSMIMAASTMSQMFTIIIYGFAKIYTSFTSLLAEARKLKSILQKLGDWSCQNSGNMEREGGLHPTDLLVSKIFRKFRKTSKYILEKQFTSQSASEYL